MSGPTLSDRVAVPWQAKWFPQVRLWNTPWKINGWNLQPSPIYKAKWSEPNLHDIYKAKWSEPNLHD